MGIYVCAEKTIHHAGRNWYVELEHQEEFFDCILIKNWGHKSNELQFWAIYLYTKVNLKNVYFLHYIDFYIWIRRIWFDSQSSTKFSIKCLTNNVSVDEVLRKCIVFYYTRSCMYQIKKNCQNTFLLHLISCYLLFTFFS